MRRFEDILPPHANAENHRRFEEWAAKATPEEKRQSLIDAGIITPDGKLAPYYRERRRRRKRTVKRAPRLARKKRG